MRFLPIVLVACLLSGCMTVGAATGGSRLTAAKAHQIAQAVELMLRPYEVK